MSKLNLEDVLFICLGRADATESRPDVVETDSWRDAVVLTEAEAVGGTGATWVSLEAVEDDVCRLLASLGGASDAGWSGSSVLVDKLLSGVGCLSSGECDAPSLPPTGGSVSVREGPVGALSSPCSSGLNAFEVASCIAAGGPESVIDTGFLGLGALKSCTLVPLILGS
jgi:hypothetical protein